MVEQPDKKMPRRTKKPTTVCKDSTIARVHRHTLIEMNIAVFIARRNAGHDQVVSILRREMMESSKELREQLYMLCVSLLDEAILCTHRSQELTDSPVLHYLTLLRDTIAASLALVRHEMTLVRESEEFSEMLNEYVVAQLKSANTVFSDSEMNILDCIDDMLMFGEPIIKQDSDEHLTRFTQDDKRRYGLALDEYSSCYEKRNEEVLASFPRQ